MNWLKRIFSTEEEKVERPIETISIAELPKWFETVSESKFEELRSEIVRSFSLINEQRELTKKKLDALGRAELQNPNIPERAKQIMEGNRDAYMKQYGFFLRSLEVPHETEHASTIEFCDTFVTDVQNLVQSTGRNTQIMNEFFSRELAEVNKGMKSMHDAVDFVKQCISEKNQDLVFMDGLKDDIVKLQDKLERKIELSGHLHELEQKIESSKSLRDKLNKQEDRLRQSPQYTDYARLSKERSILIEDEKRLKSDLNHLFSQIDRALRKYQRIAVEHQEIVEQYADDPVNAILGDGNLVVLSVLDRMKLNVVDGTLGLKEKDQEKIIQRIDSMNREIFEQFLFQYNDLKNARKKVDEQYNSSRIVRELEDVEYKLNHLNSQMESQQEKIDVVKKNLNRLQIADVQRRLEEQLGFFIDGEVTLTSPGDTSHETRQERHTVQA